MLFERYKDAAVRTAYLITGNRSICEDIVQETFVKCYKCLASLRNPGAFEAWFYRILTRIAWEYAKRTGREVPRDDIAQAADEINADVSAEKYAQSERNRVLYAEIARLAPGQRAAVVLYYFNGLSTKEIAMALNCFEGTVESRLYNARQTLKRNLETAESTEKECSAHAKVRCV